MKCPRCKGTGHIANVTRYRIEIAEATSCHPWWHVPYDIPWDYKSTTKRKLAFATYDSINRDSPLKGGGDLYKRLVSISARGRRRVLRQDDITL
jgi:hypothetical protein